MTIHFDLHLNHATREVARQPEGNLRAFWAKTNVVIDGCNSEVPNIVVPGGSTIADLVAECSADATNHGQFVSCVSHMTNDLKKNGTITGQQKSAIQKCAAQADIP